METSREIHDDNNLMVSKWTLEESKLLIASVKEQPELYDPRNAKYKLLSFTDNLWANFDLLLKKPMGASKDRWAVLRQTFRREYMENKENSKWKLYKHMYFLRRFLYSRGPTLNECIQKALRSQTESIGGKTIKREHDEPQMITVMSPNLPDGIRGNDTEQENFSPNIVQARHSKDSYAIEMHCDEAPEPNFTFVMPDMEPISNSLTSTPIVPPDRKPIILKRSLPDGIQVRKISKMQKISPPTAFSGQTLSNVKVQKISTSQNNTSEHFTLTLNDKLGAKNNSDNASSAQTRQLNMTNAPVNKSVLNPHNYSPCSCTADGDMMFMQSLVPDLKKLNSEQRMEFKVQVHQLLQNLLYKHRKEK